MTIRFCILVSVSDDHRFGGTNSYTHVEHAKKYVTMAMNDPSRFGCDASLTTALKTLHAKNLAIKSYMASPTSDKQSSTSRAAIKKKRLELQRERDQARCQLDDLGPIMNHVDPAMITKRFMRSHVPGQQTVLIKRLDAECSVPVFYWRSHNVSCQFSACHGGH